MDKLGLRIETVDAGEVAGPTVKKPP